MARILLTPVGVLSDVVLTATVFIPIINLANETELINIEISKEEKSKSKKRLRYMKKLKKMSAQLSETGEISFLTRFRLLNQKR